jgi:hypothetical protein
MRATKNAKLPLDYRVVFVTDRDNKNGGKRWRECGVGFVNRDGSITCRGATIYGPFHFVCFDIEGDDLPENTPDLSVKVPQELTGGRTKWIECGVGFKNSKEGFNLLVDTPAGQGQFCLFPPTEREERDEKRSPRKEQRSSQPRDRRPARSQDLDDEIPF